MYVLLRNSHKIDDAVNVNGWEQFCCRHKKFDKTKLSFLYIVKVETEVKATESSMN
jgi:hypothetical protein